MTSEGILFLAIAWSSILILVTYCFIKVIKSERSKKV